MNNTREFMERDPESFLEVLLDAMLTSGYATFMSSLKSLPGFGAVLRKRKRIAHRVAKAIVQAAKKQFENHDERPPSPILLWRKHCLPKQLFLYCWGSAPDVFNCEASTGRHPHRQINAAVGQIRDHVMWPRFWESSGTTCGQVKTALENFIADVRSGAIPRRYVPSTPDGFVLRGWILKCQTRFQA